MGSTEQNFNDARMECETIVIPKEYYECLFSILRMYDTYQTKTFTRDEFISRVIDRIEKLPKN